jgi:hypothetical protein
VTFLKSKIKKENYAMAEASFLSSQKARTDALQQRHNRKDLDSCTRFQAIRKDLLELKKQLLLNDEDGQETMNARDKMIEAAREKLRTIRKEVSTSDDAAMIHVSDLRWIHRELSECQERLAALIKLHQPPFTFRRYRAAIILQQQQQEQQSREGVVPPVNNNATAATATNEGDGNRANTVVASSIRPGCGADHGSTSTNDRRRRGLSGFDAAELRLAGDGQLYVNGAVLPDRAVTSDAIILSDITACTVHLYVYIYICIFCINVSQSINESLVATHQLC